MFDLRVWRRYWCRWDVTAHPKPPAVSGVAPWADDWGDLLREEEAFLELLGAPAAPAAQLRGATPPAPPGDASPPPKPTRFTPIGAASDSTRSLSPVATPSLKAPSSSMRHPLRSAQSFRVDGGATGDDDDDEGDAY